MIEFPKFDGSCDPSYFILRIEEFFDFVGTSEELRLCIVLFHLEGQALDWFRRMKDWGLLTSWKWFLIHLRGRFETAVVSNGERDGIEGVESVQGKELVVIDEGKRGTGGVESIGAEPTVEPLRSSKVAIDVAAPKDQKLFDEMSITNRENTRAQMIDIQKNPGNIIKLEVIPCEIAIKSELPSSKYFVSAYLDEVETYLVKEIEVGHSFENEVCFSGKILEDESALTRFIHDGGKEIVVFDEEFSEGCLELDLLFKRCDGLDEQGNSRAEMEEQLGQYEKEVKVVLLKELEKSALCQKAQNCHVSEKQAYQFQEVCILKEFLQEIKIRKCRCDKDKIVVEFMNILDGEKNKKINKKITLDEFVNGMIKLLDDRRDPMNKRLHPVKSLKDLYEVLRPWIEKKREEFEMIKNMIPSILEQFQNSKYEAEDGSSDFPAIKRLFKDIDLEIDINISCLNGNHIIQKCLQCFPSGDSEFSFVAKAKCCIDMATHQHGCCVLQRCSNHSTREHQAKLITEIPAIGLLLAKDAFGNYVVQLILELKIPYYTAMLANQFEGYYVPLSTQTFSSRVVERSRLVCEEEALRKIIHEFIFATYFDQLLQEPQANYDHHYKLSLAAYDSLEMTLYAALYGRRPLMDKVLSHSTLRTRWISMGN